MSKKKIVLICILVAVVIIATALLVVSSIYKSKSTKEVAEGFNSWTSDISEEVEEQSTTYSNDELNEIRQNIDLDEGVIQVSEDIVQEPISEEPISNPFMNETEEITNEERLVAKYFLDLGWEFSIVRTAYSEDVECAEAIREAGVSEYYIIIRINPSEYHEAYVKDGKIYYSE